MYLAMLEEYFIFVAMPETIFHFPITELLQLAISEFFTNTSQCLLSKVCAYRANILHQRDTP